MPSTRTPALGVMKFTILVDPSSLDIITIPSVCSMPGSREEDNNAFSLYDL